MTTITNVGFTIIINVFKIPKMINYTLFWPTCFINVNSIVLQHFITHTNIGLKTFVLLNLATTVNIWSFNVLFKGKLSSDSNLIFMKSLSYSPTSAAFIVNALIIANVFIVMYRM